MPDATLPHQTSRQFITDGGMETYLIFDREVDLPEFASFPLIDSDAGRTELRDYFEPYLAVAKEQEAGFILETPTWRANPDWATKLGYDTEVLARVNTESARFTREIGEASGLDHWVVSGAMGPRGDGYVVSDVMSAAEAFAYHRPQIAALAAGGVDLVTPMTITYAMEATGLAMAAQDVGIPAVIAFTLETDGQLPDGSALGDAIEAVDVAAPGAVAYFMINCAHPTHFAETLPAEAAWLSRIKGIRANASTRSHAELDEATELDSGDPRDLADRYRDLQQRLPELSVFGGCCGTDSRHVAAIGVAVAPHSVT